MSDVARLTGADAGLLGRFVSDRSSFTACFEVSAEDGAGLDSLDVDTEFVAFVSCTAFDGALAGRAEGGGRALVLRCTPISTMHARGSRYLSHLHIWVLNYSVGSIVY